MTNWETVGMTEQEYLTKYGTYDTLQKVADRYGITIKEAYIRFEGIEQHENNQ